MLRLLAEKKLQALETALFDLTQQIKMYEELRLPELDHVKIANFSGEGAAEKILREAENSNAKHVVEAFLHDVPISREESRQVQASRDQVLRLSQTLFFLRYNREAKNMKDGEHARRDFEGSLTDLVHVANASACSIFHTSDIKQSKIAAAVYDHLNVPAYVLLYSVKEGFTEVSYQPSNLNVLLGTDPV